MAKSVAPSSVTDIIRLIEAAEDPFTTLGLPLPSLDDLGRPFTVNVGHYHNSCGFHQLLLPNITK